MPKPLLELRHVARKGPGNFELKGISFQQHIGEKIGIAGETGAGKSTVLKLIAGLMQPDGGEILFEGMKVLGPDDQLVPGHPRIAYLSQHFELPKSLRVEQVLSYANKLSDRDASTLYELCQIEHLLTRRTDELSGGEKQRTAICRLLISRPRLLLLDEPYSHLDMAHKMALKDIVRDIGLKLKITCLLVSHDPQDTLSWADKLIAMRDGTIAQMGTPGDLYHRPVDEYVAGLFGKFNVIERGEFRKFSRLAALKKVMIGSTSKLLVRPEQFRIVRKSDSALRGRVETVQFYGTYSEAEIAIGEKIITVRTPHTNLQEGQEVYLSAARTGVWSI